MNSIRLVQALALRQHARRCFPLLRFPLRQQPSTWTASIRHGSSFKKDAPHGMYLHVDPVYQRMGTAFGTLMWLWIFWRAKNDGKALLGLEHPWDHHEDHGDQKVVDYVYTKVAIGERPTLLSFTTEDDE